MVDGGDKHFLNCAFKYCASIAEQTGVFQATGAPPDDGLPDWEFAGIYYDEGISGTKKEKRTELLKMISDCESKKIDFIVTKSISRFARNTIDCLEIVRKLIDLGIFIYFESENINTGSMESELMLTILSGIAESESTSIQKIISGLFKDASRMALIKYHTRLTDMTMWMERWK